MMFVEEILNDIDWRIGELASLKQLITQSRLTSTQRELLIKHSIPIIYSLWEGFISSSFDIYIRELNGLRIRNIELHINILTYSIDFRQKLSNRREKFDSKVRLVDYIFNLEEIAEIPFRQGVLTESNVNFQVLNEILMIFNLSPLDNKFKAKLKRLLKFRNHFAHGENSIRVELTDVQDFSNLMQDLMYEVVLKIEKGYTNRTYLNN